MDGRVGEVVVKRVLMVAYHYPPIQGSSGVQRTLSFSRYLPEHGWQPTVLTVHPRAYPKTHDGQLGQILSTVTVKRAFALDTSRHLSIRGAYPGVLALPDRWSSWWLGAVPAGLRLIRRHRPEVLWSTFPIATAHLIGLTLHRLTGIPWVADFRDSMTEDNYPPDRTTWRLYRWIEKNAVMHSRRAVFTTRGAVAMYAARYPEIPPTRWSLIANGYDEDSFVEAEKSAPKPRASGSPAVLVHSGLLYPSERDPRVFFAALAEMMREGVASPANTNVILRASGYDEYYEQIIREHGLQGIVRLEPAIPYRAALGEMLSADGLLIFQASNCNHQVPAKLYEYLRARRPILALTDPTGDTAAVLRDAGLQTIAPLDSKDRIKAALTEFLQAIRERRSVTASAAAIMRYSRRSQASELAALLDSLCTNSDAAGAA